jgi:hypothetical protein
MSTSTIRGEGRLVDQYNARRICSNYPESQDEELAISFQYYNLLLLFLLPSFVATRHSYCIDTYNGVGCTYICFDGKGSFSHLQ